MKINFNKKFDSLARSEIRNMSVLCENVRGINLSQGVCDLPVPKVISRSAVKAINAGHNQYSSHEGLLNLRKGIAKKAIFFNHIRCDAGNIVVCNGATGAFLCACLALLPSGSEVIMFEPFYSYHKSSLELADCKPVFATIDLESQSIDVANLERLISEKTRAILINTPNNPSGKVFSREELESIADFVIKHNLLVFTDEIYEYFTYDQARHVSPASLPRIADRTITISGFSKVFSITGWRVGYCIASKEIAQRISYINDLIYICSPTPLQFGAMAGILELKPKFYINLRAKYQEKRRMICDALREAGFRYIKPQGAYYILVDSSSIPGKNSKEKALHFLQNSGIALVPGESFYEKSGAQYLRLCFAKDDKILKEACRKIIGYSKKYGKK